MTAWGTDAIARSSQDGSQLTTIQSRGDSEQVDVQIDPFDTIADELIEFASAVRGEGSPEIDGGEARRTVAVLEAIVQSAGKPTARSTSITIEVMGNQSAILAANPDTEWSLIV